MIVHRLDMATSGLLLVAKTKEVHQDLQAQFANRSIKKRYVAVLDGAIIKTEKETKLIAEKAILIAKETVLTKKTAKAERTGNTGRIELPLCLNPLDRPRQMVSSEHGKKRLQNIRSSVSLKELPVNLKTLSTNQTGLMNQNGVSMSQENTPGLSSIH